MNSQSVAHRMFVRSILLALPAVLITALAMTQAQTAGKSAAPAKKPAASAPASRAAREKTMPRVRIKTNQGDIVVELDKDKAPLSTENFLQYVKDGFYTDTIFHRVIPDFMIQGGGFTTDFQQKKTRAEIKNEWKNGLKNNRGTIAMARTAIPDSATAQFFINLKDNGFLDNAQPAPPGHSPAAYAVFGHVVQGMDVVDKIAAAPTRMNARIPGNPPCPDPLVIIQGASIEEAGK